MRFYLLSDSDEALSEEREDFAVAIRLSSLKDDSQEQV